MEDTVYNSPIGNLHISANNRGLTGIHYPKDAVEELQNSSPSNPHLKSAFRELDLYFSGKLQTFDTPLDAVGTPFQKSVWNELSKLPFGTTVCYGEIAERIGNLKASRAVGLANNRNPISIIVPCHRVIGKDGKLIGYGGKIWRKEWLLKHEGILL
ncbi:methylated-DNA--[protein]-cysteine S-methyltransferase [Puniceicoccaceae bacterium K14]|nr:methylated-DNA--[protein]-cysteine S-methyltransferase [Puniceicoccaceae bacterium K14]